MSDLRCTSTQPDRRRPQRVAALRLARDPVPTSPLLDAVLACGLAVLGVAQLLYEDAVVSVVLMLGITLPVALRRIAPLTAVVVSWAFIFVEGGLGADVTSRDTRRSSRSGSPCTQSLGTGSGASAGRPRLGDGLRARLGDHDHGLRRAQHAAHHGHHRRPVARRVRRAPLGVGPGSGRGRRSAGARREGAPREDAVDDERTRIAREVHDVLGHTLGLMVLQLDAADQNLDSDPVRAREAVRSRSEAGKSAWPRSAT